MKRLQTICAVMAVMTIVGAVTANLHAELIDWGSEGEYFYDTDTGLYWWDPAEFVGWSYSDIDDFVTANPIESIDISTSASPSGLAYYGFGGVEFISHIDVDNLSDAQLRAIMADPKYHIVKRYGEIP